MTSALLPWAFASVFDCALASASSPGEQRALARPGFGRVSCCTAFPAPLSVACPSFGFVDANLPDSRRGRCRQSVELANTSLLTARRLRPAGLRAASRRLRRRSLERTTKFYTRRWKVKIDVLSGAEVRLSHKRLAGRRPGLFIPRPRNSPGSGRMTCPFLS